MPFPDTLTVAVTGPTGTFGHGLVPLLEAEPRVERVVGLARRPFDPAEHGWTKMTYRQGDVRDPQALRDAFDGVDVVVHLAFMITGNADRATIRAINVDGTLNVVRAAAASGAKRLVYASSVAAYGFHADNPIGMTESQPTRPASHLFYAQEKAEIELALAEEPAARYLELYLLRPPGVVGPHAIGGKDLLPGPLAPIARRLAEGVGRLPVPLPVPVADLPFQLIHEDDVGQAFVRCITGEGPPGAYNIAGDGVLTAADAAREVGLLPLDVVPDRVAQTAAKAVAALPFVPPAVEWAEAASHPAIMDITKAKQELGFRPRFTAREALRDTLDRGPRATPRP